jgi:poly(A) polymerase
MLAHKRFRAAYDFLLLRRDSGEPLGALCDWWTEFQTADDVQKQTMIDSARPNRKRKPKRKPKAS